MPVRYRYIAAIVMLASLAACGGNDAEQGGGASGEVLEGTISDDMIALEKVKSQAPLQGERGRGDASPADTGGAEASAQPDQEPDPASVEEAEPEPEPATEPEAEE